MRRSLLVLAILAVTLGGDALAGKGRLVLVRHGESQANLEKKMAGRLDVPLTARGRKQAREVGKKLRRFRFDRAYSSTRRRARDTMTIALDAAGQAGVPSARRSALDERAFGFLDGMTHAEAAELFGDDNLRRWRLSRDEGPPGGESMAALTRRTLDRFEREILPQVRAGKTVLVVSHKHTLRALIGQLEGLTQAELERLEVSNADPIVFTPGKGKEMVREPAARPQP